MTLREAEIGFEPEKMADTEQGWQKGKGSSEFRKRIVRVLVGVGFWQFPPRKAVDY